MTALIFNYNSNCVAIAMDTLAHSFDKTSFLYESKFYYFEKEKTAICGVGNSGIKKDWYNFVLNNIPTKNIIEINKIATEKLLVFDNKYPDEFDATIYNFGYNEGKDKFEGFVYRKENGFISEKLYHGFGTRPKVDNNKIVSIYSNMELINKKDIINYIFIQVMKEQKKADDRNKIEDRVFIGGDIELLIMTKDSCSFNTIYNL
ncbi:MAG TPA: hypothetical protein GXX63_02220 [Tissierellia bacterium]|nr:hypothetical protein [Tissierellia bacterium]